MNIKSTLILLLFTTFALSIRAQVPNGGFEAWTNGSPDSWYNTNIATVVTNITQETPSYSGTYAVKGEVINFSGSPYSPLMASTDQALNGFTVSQSYSTFSFYYKMNITGTAVFEGSATFYDAMGNWVASSGQLFTAGTVNSYTLANFPFNYGSANPPVECIIIFSIHDTVATDPPIGNYFIVDGVTLSGNVGVEENMKDLVQTLVFPNPATDNITIVCDDKITEWTIYNTLSQSVASENAEAEEIKIDCRSLDAGIYFINIKTGSGETRTDKIIIGRK